MILTGICYTVSGSRWVLVCPLVFKTSVGYWVIPGGFDSHMLSPEKTDRRFYGFPLHQRGSCSIMHVMILQPPLSV